ncbi:hypothetical protein GN244_ATG04602 [Phytophthora infestans]|uniref:Secreted RxLR effector peptide protein n=1 Tax=Phytophthora infestans TaxID=4787 RepID=A0A833TH50_PHYIN|nr:hypothetical protein GN244_ATG04602 [Phytophthora infestans]KAF4130913.1 hypothetical protein GN958_ATG19918 [Phytophthora infestans]
MHGTCSLSIIVASFCAISMSFTRADDTALINNAHGLDSDSSRGITSDIKARRLRSEATPPIAASYYLMQKAMTPSTQSQIVHPTKKHAHEPTPKWAKAVGALVSLGLVSGIGVALFKSYQMPEDSINNTRTEST